MKSSAATIGVRQVPALLRGAAGPINEWMEGWDALSAHQNDPPCEAGGPCQLAVAGEHRRVQGLGQRHVDGIVRRQIVGERPDPIEQRLMPVTLDVERPQVIEGGGGLSRGERAVADIDTPSMAALALKRRRNSSGTLRIWIIVSDMKIACLHRSFMSTSEARRSTHLSAGYHVTSLVVDPGRAGAPASAALTPDDAASCSPNNLLVVDGSPGHNTVERLARTRRCCTAEEAGRTPEQTVAEPSPVLNREQTAARLSACEEEIRTLGVTRLALFGSVLRGHTHPQSDVDFLVEFAPGAKSYDRFLALLDLLESRLGRPVELVTREALSPFIGPRILQEAQDVLRAA